MNSLEANITTALNGLEYTQSIIEQAIRPDLGSPFLKALGRVADFHQASAREFQETEQLQQDLFYLFPFLHLLRGGYYQALWDILAPVHAQCGRIVTAEAKTILTVVERWPNPNFDARLGYLHPIEWNEAEERWKTLDATYLRMYSEAETLYARYEVQMLADQRARGKALLQKGKEERK